MQEKPSSIDQISSHNLMWFRSDLRITDNTALSEVCNQSLPVIALYIATPMQWHQHHVAPIQVDLIKRRLAVLTEQLAELSIPLIVLETEDFDSTVEKIEEICLMFNIASVHCNNQYLVNEEHRDQKLAANLKRYQISLVQYDDDCALAPGSVLNKQGEPFKVFTPYSKAWLKQYKQQTVEPTAMVGNTHKELSQEIEELLAVCGTVQHYDFQYPQVSSLTWPVDDEVILQHLYSFCCDKVGVYHQQRDYPSLEGTSTLSPYLAIGALSVRQCLKAVQQVDPSCLEINKECGGFVWVNELIWREFYRHLMAEYKHLCKGQPFQAYTQYVTWNEDSHYLKAWQQGKTGFPIVDAAMRQLQQTGWMHNRLRMITASFLTKDLLLHWHHGERWFLQHLIDGDFASNNGGWQWAASTGTDAQPYFRVFNPTTQGERFDPEGEFIRKWIPELVDVPNKYIHTPHLWHGDKKGYPAPIIDHKQARLRAIEVFKNAKEINTL
ncbi:deoxyribodipyrimidine photo-lyase [Photobacterium damselae]|uniref:deoxyribodipyrimidine photo-lyase n=1 Tax=Photobacterium damselae TaxID=38293 RepID=UPI00083B1627|nr:deoxyribodipyrimidine photo-lyase [Photobacterium damselae]ODA23514.1 deoxyribodipyrimidine photo-lyase [Photobacterium damselae subsp. damselae]TLS72826.1 deoxyribodipyrimidine photo-lyase [Photobacterium damselae subsp. damselae]